MDDTHPSSHQSASNDSDDDPVLAAMGKAVGALRRFSHHTSEILEAFDRAAGMRETGASYRDIAGAGKPTALTLYYNVGCGDGPAELDPVAFTRRYVSRAVRDGLDYVLLSYYEDSCGRVRPSTATWTAYFQKLHALYPHALLGFGEIGMTNPITSRTLGPAESLARHYYGLTVKLPYYIGGYFWWYYAEDYNRRPMSRALRQGFQAEASSWRRR